MDCLCVVGADVEDDLGLTLQSGGSLRTDHVGSDGSILLDDRRDVFSVAIDGDSVLLTDREDDQLVRLGPDGTEVWTIWDPGGVGLEELLAHCGSSLEDVVQAHIYLLDPRRDYRGFERVWRKFIPEDPPAMTVIPSTGIMFHGPLIEIDFIAKRG